MAVSNTKRIILLGKTGVGKSSLANTIFGEELFQVDHSFNSGKSECQAETRFISERSITLIDTPGFFDTERSEKEMKSEIVRCIIESAPGPHALVIVLKVERFTKQEQAVINKICQHFSENVLKYATVVFTHGDQLPEGMKIEEYVNDSEGLSGLMKKCGGRCHVVDNKYWKKNQQDEYRSNQVQVAELLKTIDKIVEENNREYFSNAKLQEMERAIQKEEERIKKSSGNKSQEEIRKQAKSNVFKKQVDKGLGMWIRGVMGFAAGLISSKSAEVIGEAGGQDLTYERGAPDAEAPVSEAQDAGVPDSEAPDAAAPDAEAPDAEAPEPEAPEPEAPDAAAPDAEAPEPEAPEPEAPDAAAPDAEAPDAEAPDAAAPDAEVPDAEAPDAEAPEPEAPEPEAPDAAAPDAEAPDAEAPDAAAPDAEAPDAEAPDAEAPDAEAPEPEAPDAEAPDSEAPDSEAPDAEAPDAAVGQPNTSEAIYNDLFEKAYEIWNLFL